MKWRVPQRVPIRPGIGTPVVEQSPVFVAFGKGGEPAAMRMTLWAAVEIGSNIGSAPESRARSATAERLRTFLTHQASVSENGAEKGLESSRYCYRQPLNLVKLLGSSALMRILRTRPAQECTRV